MNYESPRRPEDDLEQLAKETFRRASGRTNLIVPLALAVVFVLWLTSGIYVVQPGENGVVRTFGRHTATTSPGINYHIPWPVETADVVDVQSIRRIEIGFRSAGGANGEAARRVLEEALMLTKDENIVEVGLLVQYRVADPAAFVFNVQDPDRVLATTSEVALRSAVGQMPIDDVITERRAEVQQNTRTFMEQLLNFYNSGIQVTDVRLQVADAPEQVRDAYQEVVRAREDRERKVNEGEAYREDIVPKARGEARTIIEAATAFKQQRVLLARGDSERFLSILNEYRNAPAVTRERMYLETLETVLSSVDKVVIDEGIQNGVLPFLPLRGIDGGSTTRPTPQPTAQPTPLPTPLPTPPPAPTQPSTGGQ